MEGIFKPNHHAQYTRREILLADVFECQLQVWEWFMVKPVN